jgi:hypothetical protein
VGKSTAVEFFQNGSVGSIPTAGIQPSAITKESFVDRAYIRLRLQSLVWRRRLKLMDFEIPGDVTDIETIAVGRAIHELHRLRRQYGKGRWRKLKGVASIRLPGGRVRRAELHWYDAHGIGRREFKRKRYLD